MNPLEELEKIEGLSRANNKLVIDRLTTEEQADMYRRFWEMQVKVAEDDIKEMIEKMGTWKGTMTIKFDGLKAKDRDELVEKLWEMIDHDYMEIEDVEEHYEMSADEMREEGWML